MIDVPCKLLLFVLTLWTQAGPVGPTRIMLADCADWPGDAMQGTW